MGIKTDTQRYEALAAQMEDAESIKALVGLGNVARGVQEIDVDNPEKQYIAVPEGMKIETVAKYLDKPLFKQGTVKFFDVASLADYLSDQDQKTTRIFCSVGSTTITAVLDYHDVEPAFGKHVATMNLPLHPDWVAWKTIDDKWLSQSEFANFLDEHIKNVVQPDSADLVEAANALELNKSVIFKSAINLNNGMVQFAYAETEEQPATAKVSVPRELVLGLSVFKASKPQPIDARLRYNVGDGGRLRFKVLLNEAEKAEEMAFLNVVEEVRAKATAKGIFLTE